MTAVVYICGMKMRMMAVLAACAVGAGAAVFGFDPKSEDMMKLASNYYAYPWERMEAPALTPAPEGYEPFHIEHYGRHGSRWLIGAEAYREPVEMLEVAERNGKLTERGAELLEQLRDLADLAWLRDGELTPLGARQHQGIARRMFGNFPQVFADSAHIDARSTTVVRCILSMLNEVKELQALNPALDIATDASRADMYYMNLGGDSVSKNAAAKGNAALEAYNRAHPVPLDYLGLIVSDPQFAADSINGQRLFTLLARIAGNQQSHDGDVPDISDVLSDDDMRQYWRRTNASWFKRMGNSPLTDNLAPYSQRNLLRNMIESADTALLSPRPGANLRFGHEVVVLPLAVLMELGDAGQDIDSLEQLEGRWHNYDIYPMACNVQMVFYRPVAPGKATKTTDGGAASHPDDDILVKVLLNEREVRLPVPAVEGPYVRWADLRRHYLERLGRIPAN